MANVITGAKAIVKIGGQVAGYATGVSITESILNGRVESLGRIDTREITPIGRVVTATCNFIRIFKTSEENGLSADEVDEQSVTYTVDSVQSSDDDRTVAALNFGVGDQRVDLQIFDSAPQGDLEGDDVLIYTVVDCKPSSQNIVVDRGSMMGVQVSMDARYLVRHDGTL